MLLTVGSCSDRCASGRGRRAEGQSRWGGNLMLRWRVANLGERVGTGGPEWKVHEQVASRLGETENRGYKGFLSSLAEWNE